VPVSFCPLLSSCELEMQCGLQSGSFSRSAVMNETGAKTGLAGLVMGLVLCSALQFFTPLFSDIPQVRM
jgi:MFS superfamily sulfate permease-like transporter